MFKIGDKVYYLFGETPQYKIMATKQEPYVRQNGEILKVAEGSDYMIVQTHLREGQDIAPFLHVPAAHLELLS